MSIVTSREQRRQLARDVVNGANMRHLWVLREKLAFAWRK